MTRALFDECPYCGAKVTARQVLFPATLVPVADVPLTEFRCGTKHDAHGISRGSRCLSDERDSAIFANDGGDA